jgi:outer membrane immunogenic protein
MLHARRTLLATAAGLAIGLATAAHAADLPVYTKAPPPVWNWTGFYAGGNLGYSWGNADNTTVSFIDSAGVLLATSSQSIGMNGVIGGGQAGYNWQTGRWVLGLETDIQATGQRGTATFQCGAPCGIPAVSETVTEKLTWFGTVRGRVGYTVTPTVLLYGTGGFGYGDVESSGSGATSFSSSVWKYGWTAGGGIETRIVGNWTAKLEYLYYADARICNCNYQPVDPINATSSINGVTDNIVRVGANYIFK